MPYKFKFERPNEECFTCNLQRERCTGFNKNGIDRCKRECYIPTNYCYQHLQSIKHLKIAPSTIPNAGKGLFAFDKTQPQDAIIFRPNQTIIEYRGERTTQTEIDNRYGDFTAPYALQVNRNLFIDSACNRGIGSLANTTRNTNFRTNARLSVSNTNHGSASLKATSNIRNGREIFVPYGSSYRLNENGVECSTKYVKN